MAVLEDERIAKDPNREKNAKLKKIAEKKN